MKISDFWNRPSGSRIIAKSRLMQVIEQDRSLVPAYIYDPMKADLMRVLSDYAQYDPEKVELHFTRTRLPDGTWQGHVTFHAPIIAVQKLSKPET